MAPHVALPTFFVSDISLSLSRRSSRRLSRRSSSDAQGPSEPLDDTLENKIDDDAPPAAAHSGSVGAQSLTPFRPQPPRLLSLGAFRSINTSRTDVRLTTTPMPLQSSHLTSVVVKSGALKKHRRAVSSVWQTRFVVLEGAPTFMLVYYHASAAAELSGSKPRGVLSLGELSVQPYGRDRASFRIRAPNRTYDFTAASAAEAQQWISCLNESIQKARAAEQQGHRLAAGEGSHLTQASVDCADSDVTRTTAASGEVDAVGDSTRSSLGSSEGGPACPPHPAEASAVTAGPATDLHSARHSALGDLHRARSSTVAPRTDLRAARSSAALHATALPRAAAERRDSWVDISCTTSSGALRSDVPLGAHAPLRLTEQCDEPFAQVAEGPSSCRRTLTVTLTLILTRS